MADESTKRLFSAFLIVRFDTEEIVVRNERGPRGPVIDYSWPSGLLLTDDEKHKIKSAADFAVPFHEYECEAVERYTFTLTSENYDKTYGFCRFSPALNRCLCILSSHDWFDFFYFLLDNIARFVVERDQDPESVCERLSTLEIKEPQKDFEITLTELGLGCWKIPDVPSTVSLPKLCHSKNLLELYSGLSPEPLITIFTMLLLERSMVFFASKLGRLTACIHAVTSLIYPLSWRHVIIPIVPKKFLQVLDCPSPSIFGVVKGLSPVVHGMFKNGQGENLVEVNLDTLEILCPEDMEQVYLPYPVLHMLNESLKSMFIDSKGRLRNDPRESDCFARSFLDAVVALIGSYRYGFTMTKEGSTPGIDNVFDEEAFFASRPPEYRQFLEKLAVTYHFQLFCKDRRKRLSEPNSSSLVEPFERSAFEFVLPPTPQGKKIVTHLRVRSKKFADAISKARQGVKDVGLDALEKLKQRMKEGSQNLRSSGRNQNSGNVRRSGSVPELSDASKANSHTTHSPALMTDDPPAMRKYEVIATGDQEETPSPAFPLAKSLLDDPELQSFFRKSKSLENLIDEELPPHSPPPPPVLLLDVESEKTAVTTERARPRALSRDPPVVPRPQRQPPERRTNSCATQQPMFDHRTTDCGRPTTEIVKPRPKPRRTLRQVLEPTPASPPPAPTVDPVLQGFDPLHSTPMPDLLLSTRPQPAESLYFSACSDTFFTPRSSGAANSLLDMEPSEEVTATDDAEDAYEVWLRQQKMPQGPPVPKPRSGGSATSSPSWVTFDE